MIDSLCLSSFVVRILLIQLITYVAMTELDKQFRTVKAGLSGGPKVWYPVDFALGAQERPFYAVQWKIYFVTGEQIKSALNSGKQQYDVYSVRPTNSTCENVSVKLQDGDVFFFREYIGGNMLPKCFWGVKRD